MSSIISVLAELLVAVLLVATIATCYVLSRRIARLKADESTMRQTIRELVLATETAERAIAGLRNTLSECDQSLAQRLAAAQEQSRALAEQVQAGEAVVQRIAQIVEATRLVAPSPRAVPARESPPADLAPIVADEPVSATEARLSKTAAIAQNLVDRAVKRLESRAA
jgi:hypothetical protein